MRCCARWNARSAAKRAITAGRHGRPSRSRISTVCSCAGSELVSDARRFEYVCLTGPTACGKTELALELAQRVPLEIISMDSAVVYRGLDIGTAKPTPEIRSVVPHHLIDILDPTESYSAGRFARDAGALIDDIRARGRLPL